MDKITELAVQHFESHWQRFCQAVSSFIKDDPFNEKTAQKRIRAANRMLVELEVMRKDVFLYLQTKTVEVEDLN